MSTPISFTPKHPQPFTLEQAMALEVDMLAAEIKRLENSIAHLQRTQDELVDYLRSEAEAEADGADADADGDEHAQGHGDRDDGNGEIRNAVVENQGVIASQTERIALIRIALLNKLGSDARLEHYGLKPSPPSATATTSTPSARGDGDGNRAEGGRIGPTAPPPDQAEAEADVGLHL